MATTGILIVDDHPLFSDGFAHMARSLRPDWSIRSAASAAAALDAVRSACPNLAIVDVGLPGEDGFALLRTFAAGWPGLPVVLISGREDEAVRVRARASGAAGFIAKTATPAAIVRMVDNVLNGCLALCRGREFT